MAEVAVEELVRHGVGPAPKDCRAVTETFKDKAYECIDATQEDGPAVEMFAEAVLKELLAAFDQDAIELSSDELTPI